MNRNDRSRIIIGVLLLILGVWWLAGQFYPPLVNWVNLELTWPLIIIAAAVFLLFIGLLTGTPDMAVPVCIVGGIGALLYWQNATGNWESWSYAWSLIPGFVGIGVILSALLGGGNRGSYRGGAWLVFISLVLFAIFGSFLGGLALSGTFLPVLLILLGVILLLRILIKPTHRNIDHPDVKEL